MCRVKRINAHLREMNELSASLLLLLLLSADFAFNLFHVTKHTLVSHSSLYYKLSAYLEIYHLIKLFWVVVLFAYLLAITRCSGYLAWILVFTFFLIDDALLIHQNIGDQIAKAFDASLPQKLSLQPRIFELSVLALAGTVLLVIVAWAYIHSSHTFRKISKDILLFIAALVFFGVIVDLAGAINLGPAVISGLDLVEDGGEMVVYSLILWYVFLLAIHNGKPELFLHELINKPKT